MKVTVSFYGSAGVLLVLLSTSLVLASDRCPPEDDPEKPPILFPHPTDCDKFIICSHGREVTSKCPPGLLWNDRIKRCDYPSESQCVPEGGTETTTEEPTTAVPDGLAYDCPPVYDPDHMVYIPHGTDCTKYFICDPYGVPLQQNCPPGLHWSEVVNYCDFPELAQCTAGTEQR
ncbi:peritrophin-1-like [Anopheles aquasalis]|uniref:Putative mucin-like peritrophin n=1 Tax=Anopheles aquasalis TaxID=42839 RepID=T1DPQ1_ANOAQ|nr:peritrophin-1-like [Anopheles aquasalis]